VAGTFGQPSAAVESQPGDAYASLLAEPQAFTLPQAVRILFHVHGRGRRILQFISEDVRIRPHLSLGFPPSDIVTLEKLPGGEQGLFRITVSMLGLYGASSPLPVFYTEELLEEQAGDRSGSRDFFDLFNSAVYTLFLWAACFRFHPLPAVTQQHDEKLVKQFRALASSIDGEPDCARAGLSGLLSQYPHSASSLQSFLSSLLQVPVRVEECTRRQAAIPRDQQARLGSGPALGETVLLGRLAADWEGKVTLCLGPLDREQFLYFSPCGPGYAYLEQAFNFFCCEPMSYDLRLSLARPSASAGAVLGRSSWGCLNGDAWLGGGTDQEREVWFPDQGHYFTDLR
jgi:type VI secretion system protein ImpH